MNQTEKIAYKWLIEILGKKNVQYQPHNTPSFILSDEAMGYEAKRLYGHSIWFYEQQFTKLKALGDHCEIIVIEDNNPEPVALIPISDIEPNKVINNILVHVKSPPTTISINQETKNKLEKLSLKLKLVTYDKIIQHLIESLELEEGD